MQEEEMLTAQVSSDSITCSMHSLICSVQFRPASHHCALSGTIASIEVYLCRKLSVNRSALQGDVVRKVGRAGFALLRQRVLHAL